MMLITGASGFVGKKIMEQSKNVIAAPSLRNLTEDQIRKIVEESEADTIVHTAAISNIGECEKDPEASYIANVKIPVYLARAANGRKLICFSSDQVYGGMDDDGPYTEEKVKPSNIYAKHKVEMEQRVLDICPDAVMLRAEWMYDYNPKRSDYFMNILNAENSVAFSSKQYRGITYVKEVAVNIEKVISLPGGAYNFGSETTMSMYDITEFFLKALRSDIRLLDAPARHNLWVDCSKAKKFGIVFRDIPEALLQCAEDHHIPIQKP